MEARGWATLTTIEERDIVATSLDDLLDILISDNPEQDFSFTHSGDGVVRVWTSPREHDRAPAYV